MNKLLGFLGIARKSQKLSLGYDACIDAIKSGKSKLIVCTNDISQKTKKNIIFTANEYSVMFITIKSSMDDIERIFKKRIALFSVNDDKMAKKIYTYKDYIEEECIL